MAGKENVKKEFFRLPGLLFLILVPFGMTLVTMAAFCPECIPYNYLGPIGALVKYLVTRMPNVLAGLCYAAWGLHVFEGYFAYNLAKKKELAEHTARKWGISTLFYGITSLKYLLNYEPKTKKL